MPGDAEFKDYIQQVWETPYGDRRQELVVIGHDLGEADFRLRIDQCPLTDEEYKAGPEAWVSYEEPFPNWELMGHSHDHHGHSHD